MDIVGKVEMLVCIGLQGPIIPAEYAVGDAALNVSYPDTVDLGFPTPIVVPKGVSTLFVVSWEDKDGRIGCQLRSKTFERHVPIYKALDVISVFLRAFKLVRVGHADGMRIRTVGIADTLFYASLVAGVPTGDLNLGIRLNKLDYPWIADGGSHPFDRSDTTKLALPHVDANTFPIARKFVQCFELLEHGYYTEATIIAHANLDDLVQEIIHDLLKSKGLDDEQTRSVLLRAIKESRLSIYLGPLLKVLSGKTIEEIWPGANKAIDWLNSIRNKIAHQGFRADHDTAGKAIFVCIKAIAGLHKHGLISAEFPKGMFRQARILAAWTLNPPAWAPAPDAIESDIFDP